MFNHKRTVFYQQVKLQIENPWLILLTLCIHRKQSMYEFQWVLKCNLHLLDTMSFNLSRWHKVAL